MEWKKFWKTSFTAFVLKNIIAASFVGLILLVILVLWLKSYTQHGVEVEVPEVTSLYLPEAITLAESSGLKLIVIDSTYSNKVPLGSIVEQNPPAGSHAKKDRALYVITNASSVRMIPIPNLRDISQRQAEATLQSLGIKVRDVRYEPSEFKDLVLDVCQGERSLEDGDRIAEGSGVILVVGRGRGTEMVPTPNLQGRTLVEARSLLLAEYLTVGVVEYDVPPTEEDLNKYVIYRQQPMPGVQLLEGSRVDVYLSTNIEKAITVGGTDSNEEDFF